MYCDFSTSYTSLLLYHDANHQVTYRKLRFQDYISLCHNWTHLTELQVFLYTNINKMFKMLYSDWQFKTKPHIKHFVGLLKKKKKHLNIHMPGYSRTLSGQSHAIKFDTMSPSNNRFQMSVNHSHEKLPLTGLKLKRLFPPICPKNYSSLFGWWWKWKMMHSSIILSLHHCSFYFLKGHSYYFHLQVSSCQTITL